MGFWSSLFGSKPPKQPARVVPLGRHWGEIEVQGESFRRDAVHRLFNQLGLPEGGVTTRPAHLVPEPSNRYDRFAVKVVVEGWHVGYVPREISQSVASALRDNTGWVPVRVWADPRDGTWRARATLFPGYEEERDFAAERADIEERLDFEPVKIERIDPSVLHVLDLRELPSVRMRVKGVSHYLEFGERSVFGGTEYLLVREPTNEFDTNAVAVYGRGRKSGFVSAKRAAAFAPLLDALHFDAFTIGGAVEEGAKLWIDVPRIPDLRSFVAASC